MTKFIDLRQRHLEKFEEVFWADDGVKRGAQRRAGVLVRAAIAAGWLVDPITEQELGDMAAKDVRDLAAEIDAKYGEAASLDPN